MTLTTKAVRGLDPRHNVFIDGVYMGVIRQQVYAGRLTWTYEPTADSPIQPKRAYRDSRLYMVKHKLQHHRPNERPDDEVSL